MQTHLVHLDRKAYVAAISRIKDPRSSGFANLALQWWDRHFSWKAQGCLALAGDDEVPLCYLFYKIDRYREYLTIHNIFTPRCERRKGYARELLSRVFDIACDERVGRFRLSCVPQSLDFYLTLGFVYWGLNSVGDYYCDLPLPSSGLDGVEAMVADSNVGSLAGDRFESILAKVDGNESVLDDDQRRSHDRKRRQMGESYLNERLKSARLH